MWQFSWRGEEKSIQTWKPKEAKLFFSILLFKSRWQQPWLVVGDVRALWCFFLSSQIRKKSSQPLSNRLSGGGNRAFLPPFFSLTKDIRHSADGIMALSLSLSLSLLPWKIACQLFFPRSFFFALFAFVSTLCVLSSLPTTTTTTTMRFLRGWNTAFVSLSGLRKKWISRWLIPSGEFQEWIFFLSLNFVQFQRKKVID